MRATIDALNQTVIKGTQREEVDLITGAYLI